MELNKIWNESNEITMKEHIDEKSIDVVLTSPPYNNSRNRNDETESSYDPTDKSCIGGYHKRYDVYLDMLTTEEYCDWIVSIFNQFDKILKTNGTVLWNTSYQAENNECAVWLSIADVIRKTNFCVVDHMIWKKKSTLPITFIFARKDEWLDFNANKKYLKSSETGQKYYAPIYNIVEAENNDELCPYNKATFSTNFVKKLLKIYAPENAVVYDPFMGSGTTALACKQMGLYYVGSELSENQCEWAENRIKNGKGARNQDLDKLDLFDL